MAGILSTEGSPKLADAEFTRRHFPRGFVFGAATSAYQVEGAYKADGKGMSNWDVYTALRPERIQDGTNACEAIDHYHKYKEDVLMMKKLGLDAYRFSIAWSRVLPGGRLSAGVNSKGVQFYNDLINFCISQQIEPYVTLFHFDLPQCLEEEYQGFLDPRIVEDFAEFADLCFWEFGDRVKHWITLNEPWTFAHNAYVAGSFPPGLGNCEPLTTVPVDLMKHDTARNFLVLSAIDNHNAYKLNTIARANLPFQTQYRCPPKMLLSMPHHDESMRRLYASKELNGISTNINGKADTAAATVSKESIPPGSEPYFAGRHLILAHATAVKIYRERYQAIQKGKIGITNMTTWFEPFDEDNEDDKAAAERAVDFMWGWFMKPIVHGDYPTVMLERVGKDRLPRFSDEEKKLIIGSYDFIGMNYYTTRYVVNAPQGEVPEPNYYTDQELVASCTTKLGAPIGECPGSLWLYIVPKGIHSLLVHTKEKYNDPIIYITENGMSEVNDPNKKRSAALKDDIRVEFYRDHLFYTKKAITDGVKVKGYFLWSMFDNYEWAEGYKVRFGIFYVDFVNHLARYPKNSAIWWMNFLESDCECDCENPTKRQKILV